MITQRSNRDFGLIGRGVIMALAFLLLAAQSFGTAHYHQKDFRDNLTQSVQGGDALCSLCLFHFHAPANPGTPSEVVTPARLIARVTRPAQIRLCTVAIPILPSRAPPRSL
jgi:hypothetical protein